MLGNFNRYGWKFILTIALPLLLASLGVGVLTFELVVMVSSGANQEDRERTRQIVTSALGSIQHQLANTVADNSYWDDAVRNLYGTVDIGWVDETWGVPTVSGINYDAMFVLDRALPNAVVGFRKGKVFSPEFQSFFGGKMEPLLDLLPKDITTHDAKAAIMKTDDGLAVVAVAPILPTSTDFVLPASKPRYMVFLKYLTPEYLAAIGAEYVIGDLRIQPAREAAANDEIIKDFMGAPVAVAQWTDRRPGDIAGASVWQKALAVLGFLAVVMAGIGLLCWRLIRKIGEREAAAQYEALHDMLTGLPNRAALMARITSLSRTGGPTLAVAFADLDGFKEVNDTYDHETGDRLLEAVAAGLVKISKGECTVCRLGGDEFVMLFEGADAQTKACNFADAFIAYLQTPFSISGKVASVGASIGIATNEGERFYAPEMMRRADIAMYQAKKDGKNRYCIFDTAFDVERIENLGIAEELGRIIANGTIDIAYQPVVDARSKNIVSVEALARWPAGSPGRVSPDKFIRVAEFSGLIDELGTAILAKACATARHWPGIRLAVNISPVQLRNPDFVANTLRTIADSGIDAHRIELEITEGVLLDDVGKAQAIFGQLRAAGIQIALDDFGSGFSSIGYLRQFKFDRIKIDRSLVDQVLLGSRPQSIVQGTMMLAAGFTTAVTAEGVEMAEQVDLLRLAGCSEMQGYYFHRPMTAEDLSLLLPAQEAAAAIA